MTTHTYKTEALALHEQYAGKIEVASKIEVNSEEDLSVVYTPGVSEVCKAIAADETKVNKLTSRGKMIGVVTDGTAVLGLGNIGPKAALPVMEGKSILFKSFAGLDAFPICLDTTNTEEIIAMVKALQPNFAGINLEDIAAPRCFEIEARLKEELDIPVFHDDQHGTAIVVLAALLNASKVVKKQHDDLKIVINGAGSAGIAIARLLLAAGYNNISLVSLEGVVCEGADWMNPAQQNIATQTNSAHIQGDLNDVIVHADVFIGVSGPNVLSSAHIATMNENPIIFALANPVPEIYPEDARAAGATVIGTGRSDYPNQINNLLAFPGIFKGILQAQKKDITMAAKVAAAHAIAEVIAPSELTADYVIPSALNPNVVDAVADAVEAAVTEDQAVTMN
ncbi:NAD(P)-dependent malic enzyme [Staphylococcus arlettae]|uniref:NAD(P)-dependent malic enzyme n=1 Tax=Staphylococcus arlettae TaxID=29378 RepID=UPI0002824328|nr:NADP-dependent malic enzyme [Staphylococcus arlettae]EJY96103.1 NAD-dependent malic enzyme [Staphylococcus arlettae CVD059]MDT3893710.1 NADP-dependent malic enzyme [Staphylococcus arlettae]QZZ03497.1 NADP-dependent malic enzyme [Staphylococcus arlettae]UXU49898.1 NADP-dependent malic enzyme [Staphylococcus arlettae]UXU52464.1 NADP-dependent malic enzyme [Staphylococcus arlettae]